MAGNLKRTATPPASVSSHSKQLRIYDFISNIRPSGVTNFKFGGGNGP